MEKRPVNLTTAHNIEGSDMFIAIVTRRWLTEPWHKDEIAYAKAMEQPFTLLIEEGAAPGNWFDGCNVVGRVTFNRDNPDSKQIESWLDSLRKRKRNNAKQPTGTQEPDIIR